VIRCRKYGEKGSEYIIRKRKEEKCGGSTETR